MRTQAILAAFTLNVLLCQAGAQDAPQPSLLQNVPRRLLLNEILDIRPASGHHFSLDAPQKCGEFPLLILTPRRFKCQVGRTGSFLIVASVCDDAKTFCSPEKFTVRVDAPKGAAGSISKMVAAREKEQSIQRRPGGKPRVEGFLYNDPARARALAKKKGALLFLEFYANWCAPCNMLDEHVFRKREFRDATEDMVRVAMDADSDVSWDWKARFKVGGYPTIVIADCDLREIGRLVGDRPLHVMTAWVGEQRNLRDEPVSVSKNLADGDGSGRSAARLKRVGIWHFERAEYPEAISYLAGHPDPEARRYALLARLELAGREGDDAGRLKTLQELVAAFPDDVEYSDWVLELLERDREANLRYLDQARQNLKTWRDSELLDHTGYNPGDIYGSEGDLLDIAGDTDAARNLYLQAAQYYGDRADESDLDVSRGANFSRAYYLRKAGKAAEATAIYETLVGAYGDESTFHYGYARALFELKEYGVAYPHAVRAEENGYGDNWLMAVDLKARIELALDKVLEAKATLRDALERVVLPRSAAIRSHGYLARLRSLQREIEGSQ